MTVPSNLYDEAQGVPMPNDPVYWRLDEPVEGNLLCLDGYIRRYTPSLPSGCVIDEAAILVPSTYHRQKMVNQLASSGWEVFNEARDLVCTSPFSTRYFVKYLFLRSPDRSYRLEVMMMDEGEDGGRGFSPLHAALWPDGREPAHAATDAFPVPHLSFKPVREYLRFPGFVSLEAGRNLDHLQTWHQAYARAVDRLRALGFIHVQTGQSTYGAFGYYLHQDSDRQIYLKPRINTRDDT